MDPVLSLWVVPVLIDTVIVAALVGVLAFGRLDSRWRPTTIAFVAVFLLHWVESAIESEAVFEFSPELPPLAQTLFLVVLAVAVALTLKEAASSTRPQTSSPQDGASLASDEIPAAVVELSTDGLVRGLNRRARSLIHSDSEELVGLDYFDAFVAAEHRDEARAGFMRFVSSQGETDSTADYPLSTPGGERYCRWTRAAHLDSSGNIACVVSYGEDITQLVTMQEALERYRILATQTRDIILFVREGDGRILEANAAAEEAYGYTRAELLTLTIHDLRARRDDGLIADQIRAAGRGGIRFETLHVRSDGSPFPVEVSSQASEGEGHDRILMSIIRDVTNRKRVEHELEEHRARLRELAERLSSAADSERRRLATEVHDRVSQPLAAAKMRLELIRHKQPDLGDREEFSEALLLLGEAIRESRAVTSEMRPPLLYDVGLRAALEWLADEQSSHGLEVELQCVVEDVEDEDVKTFVFRTARELLTNVSKHAATGRATLSLREAGDDLELVVKDNGEGFDTASLEQPSGDGRGFGLFSIMEQADYLRARVDVHSQVGSGTTTIVRVSRQKRTPTRLADGTER
jgi:PAS domain S-box-containing protein